MDPVITVVNRIQKFIEEHLDEKITLLMLSRIANYSPWYVDKIFKKYLNKTPMQYIQERRLTKAALKLMHNQPKIIDVALEFLFDSHEGFTRAFTKQLGSVHIATK